ncbi:MAG: hypothetical protein QXY40_10880 [Candidatus Methanomethylicia archaeon]
MPREIHSVDDFLKLSNNAIECRVKRLKDMVKLKLRTKKYLYTYKVSLAEVDSIIKMLKCSVKELD